MYTMTLAPRLSLIALLLSGCGPTYPDLPPRIQDCATWQRLADHLAKNAPPGNVDPAVAWKNLDAAALSDGCRIVRR